MTVFTKTLLLAGVAVLSLNACSDSKGPGALGSKNDIVVRNNGMPGAEQQQQAAADSQITSTTEQVEPLPPAEVAAGEPLPSSDPAVEAAAQKVEESMAPVPSTTTTPVTDGTTASTAPSTDTVPADVVAAEPVKEQREVEPPQLEGTATESEPVTGPATQAAATPVYPKVIEPAVSEPAPAASPVTQPAPMPASAPAVSASNVVAKPTGTHDTAYSIPAPSAAVPAPAPAEAAATTAPASGTINPYDPAIIKAAQSALSAKAGYAGAANGELSTEFLNALSKYQSENKLTPGGVNLETLRHLGVIE